MAKKKRVSGFFSDFRAFIAKGNILDMAIGVIIGAAFGKIVTSLVNDIIMPLISLIADGKAIEEWKYVITEGTEEVAESAIRYGLFIQSIIDFLIIAFCIFVALRIVISLKSRFHKEEVAATEETAPESQALNAAQPTEATPQETADNTTNDKEPTEETDQEDNPENNEN